MIETLTALFFAHVMADFLLQPDRMVAGKRKPLWFLAHTIIVLVTAVAATGSLHPALFALTLGHAVIDAAKLATCRTDAAARREICGGDFDAELLRSDYGATFGLPLVGDRVRLLVHVEAARPLP